MRLGRLRERVTIQREVSTPNGLGGFVVGWQIFAHRRAEIIGLSGDESLKIAIERSMTRWRITMRRVPGLTPSDRLVWHSRDGDVNIDIVSAIPAPKDPGMTILSGESGLQ